MLNCMDTHANNIQLFEGDCLSLIKDIPSASVAAIIADPPYFLGMTHNGHKGCFNDLAIARPFFSELFSEYARVLKPDGCVYFFCDWRGYAFYYPVFDAALHADNLLVWAKHGRPTLHLYGFAHELILFSGKIKKSYVSNVISDMFSFNFGAEKTNGTKVHPTQKPIELIERFIFDSTDAGDTVLDTFMGSGTTGVAAARNGRNFIGMEIDAAYFALAQKRIQAQGRNE